MTMAQRIADAIVILAVGLIVAVILAIFLPMLLA